MQSVCRLCRDTASRGDIDYDGASGPLDFSDVGEPITGFYDIFEYNSEGAFNVIGFETETLTSQ